jgi:rhamnogalacturonan endolyase
MHGILCAHFRVIWRWTTHKGSNLVQSSAEQVAMPFLITLLCLPFWVSVVIAAIKSSEDNSAINISNDRLSFSVAKSSGSVSKLSLDKQNLLGSGRGPYLDCHCTDDGFWTPGSGGTYKLFKGTDSAGKAYAGARMSQDYKNTGKVLEQYWFLRDGETGLHVFTRVSYNNSKVLSGGDLGELRQLFRPSGSVWTHLSSSDYMYAPLPDTSGAPTVQDASWYVGDQKNSPYVQQMSDYFTKYMFSETWRDQIVHGMYGDGSKSSDGSTFGAWLVMSLGMGKETYLNGPTHSDLTVDGIVYNYLVSNHHGNGVPEMVNGFDRTFGPVSSIPQAVSGYTTDFSKAILLLQQRCKRGNSSAATW